MREVEQLEDDAEVEVAPEDDAQPPVRRTWFNDANNSFWELSDCEGESNSEEEDWLDAMDEENELNGFSGSGGEESDANSMDEEAAGEEGDVNGADKEAAAMEDKALNAGEDEEDSEIEKVYSGYGKGGRKQA